MLRAAQKGLPSVGGSDHAAVKIAEHPSDMLGNDGLVFEEEDGRVFHPGKIGRAGREGRGFPAGAVRFSGKEGGTAGK